MSKVKLVVQIINPQTDSGGLPARRTKSISRTCPAPRHSAFTGVFTGVVVLFNLLSSADYYNKPDFGISHIMNE